jgi:group II intron reverse transcriptase/maturase
VLERAWRQVRANRGAAGIDRQTIEQVERYGVAGLLDELEADLRTGGYRLLPARRAFIPKAGGGGRRPLSIPAVRDRVVQAAVKIAIEPVFEADFQPCSFGFRPRRAAHDALQVLIDESWRGRRWVVETDIASCFEEIPHDRLMQAIEDRICDRKLLRLVRAMLRAGVMEQGAVRRSDTGTPQGGVVSPLLANVYLDRLDRHRQARGRGRLVRYADDLVVMCGSERDAHRALEALRALLAELGLRPKEAKTRIVHLREGGEGFDFLGFHRRYVRGRTQRSRQLTFLARWPSRQAMQRARDRIHELTDRRRLPVPVEEVVRDVNRFLRGWAGYFRHGNSARHFHLVRTYATDRFALFVAKRHRRARPYGWRAVVYRSPDRYGLINLNGSVVAPRPNRPGGTAECRR